MHIYCALHTKLLRPGIPDNRRSRAGRNFRKAQGFGKKKAVEVTRNGPSLGRKRQLDWRQINDGGIIDAALQYMPLISGFAKYFRD
jgi:hypothetical protein